MDEAVKALVKVAVKKEQRTMPVRIHSIPKKRAKGDLGTLSPYLRENIETDGSAEVDMKVVCSLGDHSVRQVSHWFCNHYASSLPHKRVLKWGNALADFCHVLESDVLQELQPHCSLLSLRPITDLNLSYFLSHVIYEVQP